METNTIELTRVGESTSPTWNRLDINGRIVEVPAPERGAAAVASIASQHGAAYVKRPCEQSLEERSGLRSGLGTAAQAWLEERALGTAQLDFTQDSPTVAQELTVTFDTGEALSTHIALGSGKRLDVAIVAGPLAAGMPVSGALTKLELDEGAHANVHVLVALPDGCQHLNDLQITLADRASVDVTYHLLGAGRCFAGMDIDCAGYHSACHVDVRYLTRDAEELDMNYVMRLRGRKSVATFDAYGVMGGTSTKTLRDTIDLVHGGKGAAGREQETVLLTSQGVTTKSLPVVLCDEGDVAGEHGATIGAVSPDQLEYLRTRGLTEDEAQALFARSVLDSAVAHSTTPEARAAALALAERVMGTEAAAEIADVAADVEGTR